MDVFQHASLSALMNDLVQSKSRGKKLSLNQICKKLGYRSPRVIAMVIKQERTLNDEAVIKLCRWLKLSGQSKAHVQKLAKLAKTSNPVLCEELLGEIVLSQIQNLSRKIISEEEFKYLSEWYFFPIKQLVASPSFVNDPEWISKKLKNKITKEQIVKALNVMFGLGILEKDNNGNITVVAKELFLETQKDVVSLVARRHHAQMMQRAVEALVESPIEQREIMSLCVRVDPAKIHEIKDFLRGVMSEFQQKFWCPKSQEVQQLNIQFYPHTSLKHTK